jgi:peptidoglycan/xylan/chitin deacetylase (PgdA/CDA1 family)
MGVRGITALRRAIRWRGERGLRWLKTKLTTHWAAVLLYHRVCDSPSDPWQLSVTPENFAQHLEIIRKKWRPVALGPLVRSLREGKRMDRAVAVTFDDGYADNLHRAMPLLERYDVPATVFVTTGCLEGAAGFWWDELEGLLLRTGVLPPALGLRINGKQFHWDLGAAARRRPNFPPGLCWKADAKPPDGRCALYRSLWELLRPLPEGERRAVLGEVRRWAGTEKKKDRDHRTLTPEEVRSLAEGGLVEVGAHTATHPVLAGLPAACQRREIQQSKVCLEAILDRPVTSFSYPYGLPGTEYTAETVALVREAGFGLACSSAAGLLRWHTDPYQLPRLTVTDGDGEAFGRSVF